MSIYDLKPKFQNLLRPLVIKLEQRGVTANQVTLAACAISVILGVMLTALSDYNWLFYPDSYLVVYAHGTKCY